MPWIMLQVAPTAGYVHAEIKITSAENAELSLYQMFPLLNLE